MVTFSAVVTKDEIVIPSLNEAHALYQDGYGSLLKDSKLLTLQPSETLYLLEHGKIYVFLEKTKQRLVFQELLQRFLEQDADLWNRYLVYRDLRTKGFVVKVVKGFGVNFHVYERGSYGKKMAKYHVCAVWEGSQVTLKSLAKTLDNAYESEKILRLAVIDRRGEIIYYTLSDARNILVKNNVDE